jgi:CO/xanthine dehydrogenase Mo-binding subunit
MNPHNHERSVRRLEDFRFLTERGQFAEDFTLPGELRACLLRSPMP